jgi:hypothetical protein
MSSRQQKLQDEIIELSVSNDFAQAKNEWEFSSYSEASSDEDNNCLCGQDIKRLFYLRNHKNDSMALVGCVCITKFVDENLGMYCDQIGKVVDKVKTDKYYRSKDITVLQHCRNNNIINDWEFNFMKSIKSKRNLTMKQLNCVDKINKKMIEHLTIKK